MESLRTQNVIHARLCHMTNGTFQGGYSAMSIAAMSIASRRLLLEARRLLYPSKTT